MIILRYFSPALNKEGVAGTRSKRPAKALQKCKKKRFYGQTKIILELLSKLLLTRNLLEEPQQDAFNESSQQMFLYSIMSTPLILSCGYSLEVPWLGLLMSTHVLSWKIKFMWIPLLSTAMEQWTLRPEWTGQSGPHHGKTCLWAYMDREGPDQPAHMRRLIRAFAVH